MSRITESQRMLIRSEVRHMLNRSLLREAADLSLRYTTTENGIDFYADNNANTDYAYSHSNDKVYSIDLSSGEEVLVPIPVLGSRDPEGNILTGLAASDVVDAMKVANEQAYAAAAPAAPEPVAPAKRRRAPQAIVTKIQTALGMDGADVDGVWGKDTDAAWMNWLDANKAKLKLSSDTTIAALQTNWAENSKNITHFLDFKIEVPISGTPAGILELIQLSNTATGAISSPGTYAIEDNEDNADFNRAPDDPGSVQKTSAAFAESRWLRLAGLLKG